MKKNNTAAKTAENAKQLAEALKEGTRKTLKDIINEALEDIIAKDDDEQKEEEPKDDEKADASEDGYEVEDVETDEEEDGNEPEEGEGEKDPEGKDDAEDEWSDAEEFKVGDNDYDFTGAGDDVALKFYNKLGDDDQIVITPDGDGKYEIEDKETGAEYVVELDKDADTEEAEEPVDDADADIEVELDSDDEETPEQDADIDIEFDDEADTELDEDKQFIVNDYQKGDAIEGLTNQEPADAASTISADKGIPTGTDRPYGKKGDGDPFGMNECGDITAEPMIDEDGSGLNTKHAAKKSTNHINRGAQNQRNSSEDGEYKALRESAKKIYEKAKLIQEENRKYKAYIADIKKSLMEAAVLNVSLGHMVKLMSEGATTKDEKKEIIERFGNVKTINESRTLYREMRSKLNEGVKQTITLDESAAVAPKQTINETTIYGGKTKNPSLDLMERMDSLGKYNEKFC